MPKELPVERLRRTCEPDLVACATTSDALPLQAIIGQERALRALELGLSITDPGFNLYVAGLPGTGRSTAVRRYLEVQARGRPVPDDWCYVNNFRDPYRPRALRLPAGRGRQFQAALKEFIDAARREIPRAFEGERYAASREAAVKSFSRQRDELIAHLNGRAREQGFVIESTPQGFLTIPLKEGKPYSEEEFAALPAAEQQALLEKREAVQAELKAALRQIKTLEKEATAALEQLDRQVVLSILGGLGEDLRHQYQDTPAALLYLDEVQQDIAGNMALFRGEEQPQPPSTFAGPASQDLLFRRYQVNVIVDNGGRQGAPVVSESNPTYNNLFGRIEKEAQFGALVTDFTLIHGGSLHQANGGYLVLPVEEVLRNLFSWDSLKRALRSGEIAIEEAGERLGYALTKSLQPDPIPLQLKVILIGSPTLYQLLLEADEDFAELFKVKADFDRRMDRSPENISHYVSFAAALCESEKLKHLERSALIQLVEHGSRLVEDQEKLSTRFGELADLIREASFYATREGAALVTAAHIIKAIDEKYYRSNLIQERVQEMIARGTLLIEVSGEEIGQVNGLSVISLGDITFGQPNRITASIGLGREGLVDIEREARLGGPIHTKGVLILAGFLTERFAHDKPLSLSARLVFEQSYSGVEGDSASSAELYALLSALSGLPLRQGIAVTGSVNQKGESQAIGGVNQKIEGFFEVCRARGLNGEQGVIIPESNVQNLMLKEEVLEAVRAGLFHVWPVRTVDEGIAILTGVEAGERRADGTWKRGTVNDRVDRRLRQMATALARFGREEERKGRPKPEDPPAP